MMIWGAPLKEVEMVAPTTEVVVEGRMTTVTTNEDLDV